MLSKAYIAMGPMQRVWELAEPEAYSSQKLNKKDGSPTKRASVSAISLRDILASPGYASGTIAVNHMDEKRIQCLSN